MRAIPAATLPAGLPVAERAAPLALDEAEFRAFHELTARKPGGVPAAQPAGRGRRGRGAGGYLRLLRTPHASLPADERRAYLYRIAANLVNDAWRARKKAPAGTAPAPDELAGRVAVRGWIAST